MDSPMKNNNKAFSVLIPDGEQALLTDAINCFSQTENVKIFIMSNDENIEMRCSKYVHYFSYYPKTNNEIDWISNINKELDMHSIDIVMPVYEDGFRTIIKYQHLISQKDKLCVLPTYDNFSIAINKGLLSKHMLDHQIACSKSTLLKPGDVYNDNSLSFPVLAKPTIGSGGGNGIHKFSKKEALKQFSIKNKIKHDYLIEEYIEGYDLGCNVLCKKGKIIAFTIQKGTLWGKKSFAPQIGQKFLYEHNLYIEAEKLMKSLNWSGVANIDLRFDKKDDKFKILEINTRYWSSLVGSTIAGVNFPYLYCLLSLNEDFEKPEYRHIEYLNLAGIIKRIKNNILFVFRFKFILNNTYVKFIIKDPLPRICWVYIKVRNSLMYRFGNNKI